MHLSANQISKWRRCKRQWAWEYIAGIKPPPSLKQSFGSQVHAELETWLKLGRAPSATEAGQVAAQGLHYLPTPRSGLKIEYGFDFPWVEDVTMTGFIDCLDLNGKPRGVAWRPWIVDHKSTSDLRWAMSEDELARDPQALIYAVYTMLIFGAPVVDARWVYYAASNSAGKPRRPAGCRKVDAVFSVDDPVFLGRVEELLTDSRAIIEVMQKQTPPKFLAPSPDACSTYGGCPHRERCALTNDEKIDGFFKK